MNKNDINKIMEWCYENNTIPMKDSNLRLAILDGGWVNCIELKSFLDSMEDK